MIGTGTVKSIRGEYIEVVAPRASECSSCPLVDSCSNTSLREGEIIWVRNTINATIGDYVEFEFSESDFNRGLFIVYGIPIISIVTGTIIGTVLETHFHIKILNLKNFTTFLTTAITLSIGIIIVKILDAKIKPSSYTTKIVRRFVTL
uniref:SoxR reducing system RseC family protein n=1 Tax=Caldisericum exile TaxID=693075 RepID=A0A7C4YF04_9BACT